MTKFDKIKEDIIDQLKKVDYNICGIDDIGNEIGIVIGKYTMEDKDSTDAFIEGLKHGISLIDGTH